MLASVGSFESEGKKEEDVTGQRRQASQDQRCKDECDGMIDKRR